MGFSVLAGGEFGVGEDDAPQADCLVFDLAMRFLYYCLFAFFRRTGLWVTNV
jgi:hypothetical protein